MPVTIAKKSAAVFGVLGLGGIGALAMPIAAQAAPVCTAVASLPAPVMVAPGICEIRVSTVGTGVYTFPSSGITKLSAVLVGGGGGGVNTGVGSNGYGGSGGAVSYVDAVLLDTPLTITVGVGGMAGDTSVSQNPASGTDSVVGTVSALGGDSGGGTSYSGAGAGGPASGTFGLTPGPGRLIEDLAGLDTALFTSTPTAGSDATVYSPGGQGWVFGTSGPVPTTTPTAPGSGGAGSLNDGTTETSTAGIDGLVILRYAALEPVVTPAPPVLPPTGSSESLWMLPIGIGLLSVGATVLLFLRRPFARRAA